MGGEAAILTGDFDGRDPVDAFRASSLLMEVSGGEADLERDGNICTSDAILRGSADGSDQGFANPEQLPSETAEKKLRNAKTPWRIATVGREIFS